LGVNLDVLNALNQQKAIQTDPTGESGYDPGSNTIAINNSYGDGVFWQTPRMVRLSVTYDY
jgi:hypothetical protein